jgi:hypothetical protein
VLHVSPGLPAIAVYIAAMSRIINIWAKISSVVARGDVFSFKYMVWSLMIGGDIGPGGQTKEKRADKYNKLLRTATKRGSNKW